jgi:nitrite reductase/ring-hydroxylating ferredoxin subunit
MSNVMDSGAVIPRNPVMPTGWFQVGWSGDLKPGDVRALRYFGQDLVLYRGRTSGRAVVLNAYCPHLGAHLGHQFSDLEGILTGEGGGVDGDNIVCPWHQWAWTPEGRCANVPYSDRTFRGKGPAPWRVREVNGTILVWHDLLGREPSWEPPVMPECVEGADFYPIHPWSIKDWKGVSIRPQQVMENSADFSHLRYVHRHPGDIEVEDVRVDGPYFGSTITTNFETPRGKAPGKIEPAAWGVGLLAVRLTGIHEIIHIANTTPIDESTSDFFTALVARKVPGEPEPPKLVLAMLAGEQREVERDLHMWRYAKWIDRPPFTREEAAGYRALRQWATQFYPDVDGIGGNGNGGSSNGVEQDASAWAEASH